MAAVGVLARSEFPMELEPALTLRLGLELPLSTGRAIQGYDLSYTDCPNGTIFSAPGANVTVNATIIHADAVVRIDPDGGKFRLNVHGVARTTNGTIFQLTYTAINTPVEEFRKVLARAPDAKDTEFGDMFSQHSFEVPISAPELAPLNSNIYVGVGRLLIDKDRVVTAEYAISRVILEE
ncbi:unnamed protein product [Tuber melanosporum]|uniref:(Perigord truffle) hypothetical protein n=1 Tax=Tuber melanosporum (strain Mel28) TaxID=656061 RepID=D5GIB0_TUBMM|nr:uncharacterized protein GSTUM_00008393001 [Tuber melanosporum]CAZ84253.1 unnamed protein product [Tuber melanosporum]